MLHQPADESIRLHLTNAYHRFERPISSLSLLCGFAFDAVALRRIDAFWENFWIVVHIAIAAACILVINSLQDESFLQNRSEDSTEYSKSRFWLINVLQFFLGGLLSTFMVFYFRSGSLWVSWPFFLILGAAVVANERLKRQYARLDFQVSFLFLSLFCFTIFALPILLHAIGPRIFLLSGLASLVLLSLFLVVLRLVTGNGIAVLRWPLIVSIAVIFCGINGMYFLKLIPPIPLSLQNAAVGHGITRNDDGNYILQIEDPGQFRFFRKTEIFHGAAGTPVYVYSAVFSPTSLNTGIVHEWQFYEKKRGWTTMGRVDLPVRGGRGGGFRTYSVKTGISSGAWRVNVETPAGALLGRVRFNVVLQPSDPPLITQVKN